MAARAVTRLYDDTLRSVGLRATQLAVLAAVAGDQVVSIAGLAKFMGMDRSTLTRNLAPLEREGLIQVGVEGWRRSRTVEITKKGRSRLGEALPCSPRLSLPFGRTQDLSLRNRTTAMRGLVPFSKTIPPAARIGGGSFVSDRRFMALPSIVSAAHAGSAYLTRG
jgi:DNA-binding MarR family transcriptional regulator